MTARAVGLCAILLSLLVLGSAAASPNVEQATRQLEFARTELAAGDFRRAVKSAESALRFDPGGHEAIVIKALAYEGLGEVDRATDLCAAYLELTAGLRPDPRVPEVLDRLAAAPRKKKGRSAEVVPLTVVQHEAAMRELITTGRCDEAVVPARDFVVRNEAELRAHVVLGDVLRCGRAHRSAALVYREALARGSRDANLPASLREVEGQLGVLLVSLQARADAIPDVTIPWGDALLQPDSLERGVARFELLPTGRSLEVRYGGRGFADGVLPVEPLGVGEARSVEVAPEWRGVGTVVVLPWRGALDRVEIVVGSDANPVRGGERLLLGAGPAVARMRNSAGMIELPLKIEPDATLEVDPGRWMPAGLVVSGLPTGASVQAQRGREERVVEHQVPAGGGTLEATSGVLLAAPQTLVGLAAGAITLRVKHSNLGTAAQVVTLSPGQVTNATFDAGQMPGTAALSAQWVARSAPARKRPNLPALLAGIGGGALLVGAGVAGGLAGSSDAQAASLYEDYVRTSGTGASAIDLFNQTQLQRQTTRQRGGAAAVLGSIGVIGVGVAIPLGLLIKPKLSSGRGDWDPEGF